MPFLRVIEKELNRTPGEQNGAREGVGKYRNPTFFSNAFLPPKPHSKPWAKARSVVHHFISFFFLFLEGKIG